MIRQTKTIQISTYLLADQINSPNFLSPNARKESIRQIFPRQTFPLYDMYFRLLVLLHTAALFQRATIHSSGN